MSELNIKIGSKNRGEMHKAIRLLEFYIEQLGTVQIVSRFRIAGSDGREIMSDGTYGEVIGEVKSQVVELNE